jgi:curved DNA-binding protein CbpA
MPRSGPTVHEALQILSLPPSATTEEIHAAWRRAIRKTHPDSNPGNPKVARQQFDEVQAAYRVLTAPEAVAERELAIATAPQAPFGFDQLEAFRVLGLGPRATYAEIDARSEQLIASEADSSKRNSYAAAHELLTKPHRLASERMSGPSAPTRPPQRDWYDTSPRRNDEARLPMTTVFFAVVGVVFVVGAILQTQSQQHSVLAEVAMAAGAVICFGGAVYSTLK